ncbi:ribosome hibernation-promoting factor, HPF/YfiA family [Portibacter marinus]|uniref:ribosome hibernation-promoting factor, HPF/YfiA family n=1 Tax=Portibacter marinus TaxID=2898660 RepID=UPI001F438C50|nr:ribosome-associated translation inhibitor RaiA [Portibacter marinus]
MKVVIESPFKISDVVDEMIHEKLNSLEEYKMGITQVDLYFKLDDGESDKTVFANLEVRKPGPTIFASSDDMDYVKAFNEAFSKAKRQLLKKKEQLKSHP